MEGYALAGSNWVSGNTSIVPPANSHWLGIGDYTQWHLNRTRFYEKNAASQGALPGNNQASVAKWGYMWSKPKEISQPLPCYTGEKCEIRLSWTFSAHTASYTKQSHNEKSLLQLRQIGVQIERMHNSVSFVFSFYGPSEYHLEFQQEYWASPLARKWYSFETQQYLKYPLYDNGIPVGLIHHKKGPEFEEEY
ncbi:hypothetical protein DSO57_1033753 [Entomophthora muscae]|uniref:Uncharacterized protein n=1 Tax=Entomophthora muscae TaxID=34485 RepID=A0ACC2RR13_9FUNG|nr:hypothetical protein DSO57_1033753 [Entomophthora muscae]